MKYTIVQTTPNGHHQLLRYGYLATPRNGAPTNAELEFWFRIQELEEQLVDARDEIARLQDELFCKNAGNYLNDNF